MRFALKSMYSRYEVIYFRTNHDKVIHYHIKYVTDFLMSNKVQVSNLRGAFKSLTKRISRVWQTRLANHCFYEFDSHRLPHLSLSLVPKLVWLRVQTNVACLGQKYNYNRFEFWISLLYNLHKTWKRIVRFIPFPRVSLSSPPTRQDLTQGHDPRSFYRRSLGRGSGTNRGSSHAELMLVIVSLDAMWTCLTWTHSIYYVSPARVPVYSLN